MSSIKHNPYLSDVNLAQVENMVREQSLFLNLTQLIFQITLIQNILRSPKRNKIPHSKDLTSLILNRAFQLL
jgi:hypothetical protein